MFDREADLCTAFIASLPDGWTAYPETWGWDILLSRDEDGFQIGVEAKLRLNPKVLEQSLENPWYLTASSSGPDCRAVLVGHVNAGLQRIAAYIGIVVVHFHGTELKNGIRKAYAFSPTLPFTEYDDGSWWEWCPAERLALPDYVPDTCAGNPAPVSLTPWKVKAIKLLILLDRRGYVTRADFRHFQLATTLWTNRTNGWLSPSNGVYIRNRRTPDIRAQHPTNWLDIEADFDKWAPAPATGKGLQIQMSLPESSSP